MARSFDGTNDQLERTNAISTATANFTMMCWLNHNSAGATRTAFSNGERNDGGGNGYGIWARFVTPNYFFRWDFAFVAAVDSTTTLTDGTWYHCLGLRDSTTARLYLNGTEEGTTHTSAPNAVGDSSTIGAAVSGGTFNRWFNGRIAECAFWSRALSAAEISLLADGYSPLFVPNGLISYVPIIGRNSPETDIVNSATWAVTEATNYAHPRIIYPSSPQMRRFTTAVAGGVAAQGAWKSLLGVGA